MAKMKKYKQTNPLKILVIQKFSLLKDFSCRIKRYTFFKILVSRTMPPPIKFPQLKIIQSNSFETLLVVWHFTEVSVLCNWFIFVSTNIVTKNLVNFHLPFACVVILFPERKPFEKFFIVENIVGTAPSFKLFGGSVFISSVLKQRMYYKFYTIKLCIKYLSSS